MRHFALLLVAVLLLTMPADASAERKRLLVIGDSLAGGLYATSADAGFAYVLARDLGADLGILRAPTVADARVLLPAWGWAPDTVVVELGLNDASNRLIPVGEFLAAYGALLDEIGARWPDAQIVVTTLWAGQGETPVRREYSAGLRALAAERGLPLADVAAATRGCNCAAALTQPAPFAPGYRGDGWHPGNEGHRLIAEAIAGALRERVGLPLVR